ncbi:hypothetical protein XAPC_3198 [Xanthomonas citri pv. punicae str. LMG 859]|nr:hypothetical protein XAPC_3198 [Xanthomonas citri pv. punicae str. LMG 859]
MDGGDPAAEPPAATARSLAPTHAHSCRQADAASGSGEKGATCGNGLRGLQVSGALQAFGCAVLWDVCFCCAVLCCVLVAMLMLMLLSCLPACC